MDTAKAYLILGAAGSGRRVVVTDLLANGLEASMRPAVFLSEAEVAAAPEVERRLDAVPGLVRGVWHRSESGGITAAIPEGVTHLFIMADGRSNPVDEIEAFHAWLATTGAELARVITVVHCQLVHAHPELLRWYDACVHFSDVVLLNQREGLPNKWVSDFIARFRKQHLPCLIEFVKRGEVQNPALILEPEARRISLLFDENEEVALAAAGAGDDDLGDEDEDEPDSDNSDLEDEPVAVDPYLERLAGSGRRAKEIPDIAKFLPPAS